MKKIIIISIIALVLIVALVMLKQVSETKASSDLMRAQADLINAQTNQQTSCDSSWQCTTGGLLDSLGGTLGSFNLTGLLGE